jgi:2-isopropylmalate synthase
MKKIIVFDTTLRDGEQSPGASMNVEEKVQVAKQLSRLGVDVIEAGFAISSVGDFESIKAIGNEVKGPIICSLARAKEEDIKRAYEALKDAPRKRIHTFHSTSDIHLKYQFRVSREEALRRSVEMVKLAKSLVDDVEFSPMDATRTDVSYLCDVVEAVIEAGASTVNIPDTVGYTIPEEFGKLIKTINEKVKNISRAVISVHCHNDLGLAVSNSLSAVLNGAGQIECSINGIGERAGNCSLEEVVMALRTRKDLFNADTNVVSEEITRSSRLITKITGISVQPNKAIVGANAFSHESGIHQDGLLKEKGTYEIIQPETIGLHKTNLVLGKHSGRHAFRTRLKELGYELSDEELIKAFNSFKEIADKKKSIFDDDLVAIVEGGVKVITEVYSLKYMSIKSETGKTPSSSIKLLKANKIYKATADGDGPVDAAYKSIDKITGVKVKLLDYSLKSVTSGKDALGEVTLKAEKDKKIIFGKGTSTDVIEASVKAYLNVINKLLSVSK